MDSDNMPSAKEQTDDAYIRLQENYDAVRKESTETGNELKKLTARNNERDDRSVKKLETKISHQEEFIGRQEAQINEHQSKEAEMQRRIKKLDAADERLQNLHDDFDVSKDPEEPWQVVNHGKQKNRAPYQIGSNSRGRLNGPRNHPLPTRPFVACDQKRTNTKTTLSTLNLLVQVNGADSNDSSSSPTPSGQSLPQSWPVLAARNSRVPPKTQPALKTYPNGRIQPDISARPEPAPAPKKKEKVPYEIKNAREWDPKRRLEGDLSSESSDDYYESDHDEYQQGVGNIFNTIADDRSQTVANQRSQSNTALYNQHPGRPKVYSHRRPPDQRRVHQRVNFNYKRDNLARAAFRKRLDPTGSIMLPKDCSDLEPNQKKMYDMFEEIGVRLGSFIRPPQQETDRELLLWGDARQVQATRAELDGWLNRLQRDFPRKPMAKYKFAREMSVIGPQYHRSQMKTRKERKLLEFQRVPEAGRVFSHNGTFIWPVDEIRPEDILGPSLEAFDPVRIQYLCHIVFDNKLAAFKIFSDSEESVKATMGRIEGTMREYVAKSVRANKLLLVEPPHSSVIRKNVRMLPASLNHPKENKSMIPMLTGSTLDVKALKEWHDESKEYTRKNNSRMELSLRKCIANLPHYRGRVRMRVQFGTFALKTYRWKEGAEFIHFGEFMDDMAVSETKGVLIRDLQIKKDAATIIAKVQKATDLFLPLTSGKISLEGIVPSFSAYFEFQNPNSPPMSFTLELKSSPAVPTIYETVQELWARTDRRDFAVPLEVFMARVDGGASWKLQVSSENSIDASRINPEMKEFAQSVKLSKIPGTRIELTGQRAFTWEKGLSIDMQPSSFQQKTAFVYRLANQPEWEFEIARYDTYGNPKNENVSMETNWGATLYNTSWDSTLTANSTLGIGEAAGWNPTLETFFPSMSDATDMEGVDPGVAEFLQNVKIVTNFIDSIKQELPHLRG